MQKLSQEEGEHLRGPTWGACTLSWTLSTDTCWTFYFKEIGKETQRYKLLPKDISHTTSTVCDLQMLITVLIEGK